MTIVIITIARAAEAADVHEDMRGADVRRPRSGQAPHRQHSGLGACFAVDRDLLILRRCLKFQRRGGMWLSSQASLRLNAGDPCIFGPALAFRPHLGLAGREVGDVIGQAELVHPPPHL